MLGLPGADTVRARGDAMFIDEEDWDCASRADVGENLSSLFAALLRLPWIQQECRGKSHRNASSVVPASQPAAAAPIRLHAERRERAMCVGML